MSELSRVEDLLNTGVEEPVIPMSRVEAILRGEKIKPMSRVEEDLLKYNPSDILIEKRIEENGTYYATTDNADGYFKVIVDTPVVPQVVLDHLVETITTNGDHTFTPTHDGFDTATITVAVPTSSVDIITSRTKVAQSYPQTYMDPQPLDHELVSGNWYVVWVYNPSKNFNGPTVIKYTGSGNYRVDDGSTTAILSLTNTTATFSYYTGDYLNIYIRISKIMPEQILNS